MIEYNLKDAEKNFYKISKMLEEGKEDFIVITKDDKPVMKITKYIPTNSREGLYGCAKNIFSVPKGFDNIDISSEFKEYL